MRGSLQQQLIKAQVQPSAKFEAHLLEGPRVHEAELPVQRDARCVVDVDTADQDVILPLRCRLDPMPEERASDTLTAAIFVDIDRVLDGVLIGGPRPECPKARQNPSSFALLESSIPMTGNPPVSLTLNQSTMLCKVRAL